MEASLIICFFVVVVFVSWSTDHRPSGTLHPTVWNSHLLNRLKNAPRINSNTNTWISAHMNINTFAYVSAALVIMHWLNKKHHKCTPRPTTQDHNCFKEAIAANSGRPLPRHTSKTCLKPFSSTHGIRWKMVTVWSSDSMAWHSSDLGTRTSKEWCWQQCPYRVCSLVHWPLC